MDTVIGVQTSEELSGILKGGGKFILLIAYNTDMSSKQVQNHINWLISDLDMGESCVVYTGEDTLEVRKLLGESGYRLYRLPPQPRSLPALGSGDGLVTGWSGKSNESLFNPVVCFTLSDDEMPAWTHDAAELNGEEEE
ncbi:hypothetical protein GGI00_004993 [Coemansia sp. RSA 2681]|nr:hypothetical protein GGI00_004993 [Coemansia sp. RSA 2681]